jgi:hypothetical protein
MTLCRIRFERHSIPESAVGEGDAEATGRVSCPRAGSDLGEPVDSIQLARGRCRTIRCNYGNAKMRFDVYRDAVRYRC